MEEISSEVFFNVLFEILPNLLDIPLIKVDKVHISKVDKVHVKFI